MKTKKRTKTERVYNECGLDQREQKDCSYSVRVQCLYRLIYMRDKLQKSLLSYTLHDLPSNIRMLLLMCKSRV